VLAANTPLDAFRRWFRTLADYVRVNRLGEALYSAPVQDAINKTYGPVVAAVGQLVSQKPAGGLVDAMSLVGEPVRRRGVMDHLPGRR
jgi:hypothetical protein